NHRTAQFYKNLGASRFVFPTQLSVNEVRTMTQRLGDLFEYEIIGLNDACRFLEGFCQFHHSFDDKLPFKQFVKNANIRFFILDRLKRLPFSWQRYIERNKLFQHYISSPCDFCCQISGYDTSKDGNRPEPNPEALFNDFLDTFSYCNLCGLYDFIDMGLQTVKVVGRFNPLAKKVKDVKILRRACELAVKPGISRESYVKLCQNDFKKTFGFPCRRFCLYSVSSTLKQNRVRRVG
ncbi:MAG: U32 family peptidase, partial [bacterium]|nr:U32 family peptidase [bacterium]